MEKSIMHTLYTSKTNLQGTQRLRNKWQQWYLSEDGTHEAPMSCYPTDSTQWSLWILHEKVRESNYKAQRAYVSILFHVKISSCWVNGQSFHTKPNTAGTRLHRSSACHTYVISSDLVDKVIINGLNKLCQMLTKGVTGSCSRGRAFTKNVQCRDMIPQHHRDADKKALS